MLFRRRRLDARRGESENEPNQTERAATQAAATAPEEKKKPGPKRPPLWSQEALPPAADEGEWAFRAHAVRARRLRGADANDDHCSVCFEGGALVCCVSCPRSFHERCVREARGLCGNQSIKHGPFRGTISTTSPRRAPEREAGGRSKWNEKEAAP